MADRTIHVRISPDLEEKIQELISRGEFDDVSDFVRKAIRQKLNPDFEKEKIHQILIQLIEGDPELRRKLKLD